ncbi:MAG: hypothetical protein JXQ67_03775 [Campylobacterales bacterium]|nr:hypothetical protein [Campylobacterales bacterium]
MSTITIPDPREGFSMHIAGVQLNRPDLHMLAAELGINTRDVLMENGVLTVFNTSKTCQEIIDDNALVSFIAMTLEIEPQSISNLQPAKAKPKVLDKADFIDDEDEED